MQVKNIEWHLLWRMTLKTCSKSNIIWGKSRLLSLLSLSDILENVAVFQVRSSKTTNKRSIFNLPFSFSNIRWNFSTTKNPIKKLKNDGVFFLILTAYHKLYIMFWCKHKRNLIINLLLNNFNFICHLHAVWLLVLISVNGGESQIRIISPTNNAAELK